MKTLNYVKILMIVFITLGFSSCGDEYYDFKNSDQKLCGKEWTEEYGWETEDLCVHTLKFSANGSGEEIFAYHQPNKKGGGWYPAYETNSKYFSWKWIDNMEAILMYVGANEEVYFEGVIVRDYYLTGKIRDYMSTFYGK